LSEWVVHNALNAISSKSVRAARACSPAILISGWAMSWRKKFQWLQSLPPDRQHDGARRLASEMRPRGRRRPRPAPVAIDAPVVRRPSHRLCVAVVAIGNCSYIPVCLPQIEGYCKRHGYDLVISRSASARDGTHPSWEKIRLLSELRGQSVLLLDADMAPLPHAPPIDEHIEPDALNVVRMNWPEENKPQVLARYADSVPNDWYYNCGIIYVPEAYNAEISRLNEQRHDGHLWWEQGAINQHLANDGRALRVHELDPRWNFTCPLRLFRKHLSRAYFLHLWSGWSHESRERNIKRLARFLAKGELANG